MLHGSASFLSESTLLSFPFLLRLLRDGRIHPAGLLSALEWATLGPVHVGVRFHGPGPSPMTDLGR